MSSALRISIVEGAWWIRKGLAECVTLWDYQSLHDYQRNIHFEYDASGIASSMEQMLVDYEVHLTKGMPLLLIHVTFEEVVIMLLFCGIVEIRGQCHP
ncbi:hypothetical protein L1987_85798 [Smallanthus sonchifolius]|uniref:Uncharacterized protein n=1 Tax=Smallanthus sonchifolius TaxID=185202 RepID=A0ACB8XXL0_9ASTR|nr:hypothetical protein L1987_85798 [Smallanthus sonchifolius]